MLKTTVERFTSILFVVAALSATAGCSSQTSGATAVAPSPAVEVVDVQQRDVPIYSEWIGTLDGLVNADVKAQVFDE